MLDMIKQKRMLQLTIALLVILNLTLIIFMIMNKPPRQDAGTPQVGLELFLQTELELSEGQMETLHNIRKQHFDNARPLLQSLADSLETLLAEAFKPVSDSSRVNELTRNISDIHIHMDLALYSHFAQLNALCTPEQQDRLKDLAGKLMPGNAQPPPPDGQGPEGRPPHPDERAQDGRPPPPGQGRGAPPPRDR